MLIFSSGLNPWTDTSATLLWAEWRGGGGAAHREACSWLYICIPCPWVVVLIMWQVGRLIVDKQQDYEGLCGSKGSTGWERPVICEPERKLVRAG